MPRKPTLYTLGRRGQGRRSRVNRYLNDFWRNQDRVEYRRRATRIFSDLPRDLQVNVSNVIRQRNLVRRYADRWLARRARPQAGNDQLSAYHKFLSTKRGYRNWKEDL